MIKELIANVENLESFIDNNFTEILDFFQQDFKTLLSYKDEVENLISLNHIKIRKLNKSKYIDFILLLLDTCEKLGLESEFLILFNIAKEKEIQITNRLKAVSLFLTNRNNSKEYIAIYDSFLEYLQKGYELEEDNEEKIIATLLNYYWQAVSYWGEFNQKVITVIKEKITESIKLNKVSFLQNEKIKTVLNLNINNFDETLEKIKIIIDDIVGINYLENTELYSISEYLIETDTDYSTALTTVKKDFLSIQKFNKQLFNKLPEKDRIFSELKKGVHILDTSEQLSAYMYSYGKMHYAKLMDAFEKLPTSFYKNKIEIIDWACGQAIASISYLTHIQNKKIKQEITKFILIEPSKIALERAALHIKHFMDDAKISTINRDFNSLFKSELESKLEYTKFHLFSNIIDIDTYRLNDLFHFINNNFKGTNYFVVVSPLIPNSRKSRIDGFVNLFKSINSFDLIYNIDSHSGEWIKNWSRMIRVFKVNIK